MIDIVLIAVGLLIVGASYAISEKKENDLTKKAEEYIQVKDVWTEKEEEIVRERIDAILEDRIERAINKADNELSRISNEKIMASNEFSDQVLEKINRNHEEVVFLYNMLNEKEKQIKGFIQETNIWQANMEREMQKQEKAAAARASEKTLTAVDMLERLARGEHTLEEKKDAWKKHPFSGEEKNAQASGALASQDAGKASLGDGRNDSPVSEYADFISEEPSMEQFPETLLEAEELNRNKEILNLYKEGKSILEISKAFDMGQGEVKLVIDLFQGAKV